MNKTHYRSTSSQMKNSPSLLSILTPIFSEENSYNKVKKALDYDKTKIRNLEKLYNECNKTLHNFNIHHHDVLEKNNPIKEENNLFSQTYQKIQKLCHKPKFVKI